MYSVLALIAVHQNKIEKFTPDEISPYDFQHKANMLTNLYVILRDDNRKRRAIDYSRLISDRGIALAQTWDEFDAQFTLELMLGYEVSEVPGYDIELGGSSHPLVTWNVMTCTNTFDVIYADAASGQSGLYPFRYSFRDLKIALQNSIEEKPELKNCVPVINGFLCRPIWREDALYALNGSCLCYNSEPHTTPEVMLLDFQHMGEVSVHPLYMDKFPDKSFSVSFANRTDNLTLNADWILHSQYSLYEYTPIIVIMGIPIFPDKIEIVSEYSFRLLVHDLPLHKAAAMYKYCLAETNSPADIAYSTEPILQHLRTELTRDPNYASSDCFVILVKTPRIFVSRLGTDVWRNGITIDVYDDEGLLQHDPTGRLLSYHCTSLSNKKELTIQNSQGLYLADRTIDDPQLAFVPPDCKHHEFQNLFQGNCTMIYLTR